MAVVSVAKSNQMALVLQDGTDEKGKPKLKRKTYGNVKKRCGTARYLRHCSCIIRASVLAVRRGRTDGPNRNWSCVMMHTREGKGEHR
ncbi:DUF1659 domain-containing protein [Aneurinibacillus tyrosinisolvens]|uniref:DUF1659 domain-containing protein n=1 Tax=Aneurinibacillus tyrosinisolvens TaxID=1443435 RepID=UPI00063ED6D5|nr:DUF1659 domain-containing protein [Aneurinibacillus tyrosinisolvens]